MKLPLQLSVLIVALSGANFSLAGDCSDTAKELFQNAQNAESSGDYRDAESLYASAAEECDNATYWRVLGDVRTKSARSIDSSKNLEPESFAQRSDRTQDRYSKARTAYERSLVVARRNDQAESAAATARSIVRLGIDDRDFFLASQYLRIAKQLDPDHTDLSHLERQFSELAAEKAKKQASQKNRRRSVEARAGSSSSRALLGEIDSMKQWTADVIAREYVVVSTYFATDRNYLGIVDGQVGFGNSSSEMRYGMAHVSIPRTHKLGEMERPKPYKLEFAEDPRKHVILLNVSTWRKDYFFSQINGAFEDADEASTLIYVHGYNSTFENAARRTAQLAYDLNFPGVSMFYSWPSKGDKSSYIEDAETMDWSSKYVQGFLEDVLENTATGKVYLIAHNMGGRALTESLIRMADSMPDASDRIAHIILAAPDIDANIFIRDLAPALRGVGAPISLYASSNDPDLKSSAEFHGGNPRAGDSHPEPAIIQGIETIDASRVISSFLQDGYWAADGEIIGDLKYLIHNDLTAASRAALITVEGSNGLYWRLGN